MHPSSVCPSVRSPLIHSLARVTFACPAASWHRPGRAPAPGREGAPLPPVQQRDGAPARMLQGQAGDGVSAPAPTRPRWGALGPTPGAAPCLCLAHPRWGLGRSPPPPQGAGAEHSWFSHGATGSLALGTPFLTQVPSSFTNRSSPPSRGLAWTPSCRGPRRSSPRVGQGAFRALCAPSAHLWRAAQRPSAGLQGPAWRAVQ